MRFARRAGPSDHHCHVAVGAVHCDGGTAPWKELADFGAPLAACGGGAAVLTVVVVEMAEVGPHATHDLAGQVRGICAELGIRLCAGHAGLQADEPQHAKHEDQHGNQGLEQHDAALALGASHRASGVCAPRHGIACRHGGSPRQHRRGLPVAASGSQTRVAPAAATVTRSLR
ncbi:hypothetical protein FQZ97_1053820 [compost metagenome]